ncbi:hypothetical protein [uncultured Gimesia sp.]|uniref:hypothetical protein n=1 Tax=uncultured Gimesia sp. TaxID=1678688 RepID=UPI0026335049|nr:hypothetical protein [uncultured Gimesia sp.]
MDFTSSSRINDAFTAIAILEFGNAARYRVKGCIPLLPNRLTYLEISSEDPEFSYENTTESLVPKMFPYSQLIQTDSLDQSLRK